MKKILKGFWNNYDLFLGIALIGFAIVSSIAGDDLGFFGNIILSYILLFSHEARKRLDKIEAKIIRDAHMRDMANLEFLVKCIDILDPILKRGARNETS